MTSKQVNLKCIDKLRMPGPPIIIVAALFETEAIINSCKEKNVSITAICDTEKRKTFQSFKNFEVIHTPDLKQRYPQARFLFASQHIVDVEDQLLSYGYNEFYSALELLENYEIKKHEHSVSDDYMEKRLTIYKKSHQAYFDESKIYMRSLDIMITTKCSLKCESCSNLMQYYTDAKHSEKNNILNSIKVLHEHVEEISEYRLIGGEPMMNRDWANITYEISEKHPDNEIFIYTNGTIPPQETQLEKFKGRKVNFVITEYGKLSRNLGKLQEMLDKFNITYVSTPAENWLDCSDLKKHNRKPQENQEVFKQCCVKYIYTLLDGKLYRCPFIANAANLKALPDNKANYVDLLNDNTNLSKKIERLIKSRYFFPGCDSCVGRPYDTSGKIGYNGKGMITPGIQSKQPLKYKIYN